MADISDFRVRLSLLNPALLNQLEALGNRSIKINASFNFEARDRAFLDDLNRQRNITVTANAAQARTELTKLLDDFKEIQRQSVINIKIGSSPEQTIRNLQQQILSTFPRSDLQTAQRIAGIDPLNTRANFNAAQTGEVLDLVNKLRQSRDQYVAEERRLKTLASNRIQTREFREDIRGGGLANERLFERATRNGQDVDRQIAEKLFANSSLPLTEVARQMSNLSVDIKTGDAQAKLAELIKEFERLRSLTDLNIKLQGTPADQLRQLQEQFLRGTGASNEQLATAKRINGIKANTPLQFLSNDAINNIHGTFNNLVDTPESIAEQEQTIRTSLAKRSQNKEFTRRVNSGDLQFDRFLARVVGRGREADSEIVEGAIGEGHDPAAVARTINKPFQAFRAQNIAEITNKDARELAFASILGGGGIKGSLARLGGGLALGVAGPLGPALGALAGDVLLHGAEEFFGAMFEGVNKLRESGQQFQESILAIASVLQLTSPLQRRGGGELSLPEQISAQQDRARDIQKTAREKLLPLGIGGAQESTIVSAITAGGGFKGLNFSKEQIATLSERFGSTILSSNPQLLNNLSQTRRDIEDIILGLPQARRTTLGATIRPVVSKVAAATTEEEYIEATESLTQLKDTLRNSDLSIVQLKRISGAIDGIMTTIGTALEDSLAPAFKVFANVLTDFSKAVQDHEGGIKSFFDSIINGVIKLGEVATNPIGLDIKKPLGLDFSKGVASLALRSGDSEKDFKKRIFNNLSKEDRAAFGKFFGTFDKSITEESVEALSSKIPTTEVKNTPSKEILKKLAGLGFNEEEIAKLANEKNSSSASLFELNRSVGILGGDKEDPTLVIGAIKLRDEALKKSVQEQGRLNLGGFTGRKQTLELSQAEVTQRGLNNRQDLASLDASLNVEGVSDGQIRLLEAAKKQAGIRTVETFAQNIKNSEEAINLKTADADRLTRQLSTTDTGGRIAFQREGLQEAVTTGNAEVKRLTEELANSIGLDDGQKAKIRSRIDEIKDTVGELMTQISDKAFEAIQEAGARAGRLVSQFNPLRKELITAQTAGDTFDEANSQLSVIAGKLQNKNLSPRDRKILEQQQIGLVQRRGEAVVNEEDAQKRFAIGAIDKAGLGIDRQTPAGRQFDLEQNKAKTIAELKFQGANNARAESFAQVQFDRGSLNNAVGDSNSLFNFNQTKQQAQIFSDDFPRKLEELGLKTIQLKDSFTEAQKAVKDFAEDANSRRINRELNLTSAQEQANSVFKEGGLTENIFGIDPAQHQFLKEQQAVENVRKAQDELEQGPEADARRARALQQQARLIGIQEERLPSEKLGLGIQLEAQTRGLAQSQIDVFQRFAGSDLGEKFKPGAQAAANVLGIDSTLIDKLQKSSAENSAQAIEANKAMVNINKELKNYISQGISQWMKDGGGDALKKALEGAITF